jgi:SAM-dependent methyltransferase
MATDFRAIYDRVIEHHPGYNSPAGSPGYQACLLWADRLRGITGPSLDVGCGVGYVVQLLQAPPFELEAWGVDVSRVAIERARERQQLERVRLMEPGVLPFPDAAFGLVTCFDVLEHLDEPDIDRLEAEMDRVLRPGGVLFATVSTRPAASEDHLGDNLHRTVRPATWWADRLDPDEYTVRPRVEDVRLWKRTP